MFLKEQNPPTLLKKNQDLIIFIHIINEKIKGNYYGEHDLLNIYRAAY
jgi:hypothetical protein